MCVLLLTWFAYNALFPAVPPFFGWTTAQRTCVRMQAWQKMPAAKINGAAERRMSATDAALWVFGCFGRVLACGCRSGVFWHSHSALSSFGPGDRFDEHEFYRFSRTHNAIPDDIIRVALRCERIIAKYTHHITSYITTHPVGAHSGIILRHP